MKRKMQNNFKRYKFAFFFFNASKLLLFPKALTTGVIFVYKMKPTAPKEIHSIDLNDIKFVWRKSSSFV